MEWLGVVGTLLKFLNSLANGFSSLVQWMSERGLVKQGEANQDLKTLKHEVTTIEQANEARDKARVANAAVPSTDSLPTDGYRRD